MSYTVDEIQAWFGRVGHAGPREPTLATLRALVAAHCASIPYENFDVLLGNQPDLDPRALHGKMVGARRGGYCFEQNLFLLNCLRALGFSATGLLARVIYGMPADIERFAGHMAIRVDLPDGAFLVDAGFGKLTPACPLVLRTEIVQATPHEDMRFIGVGSELALQAHEDGEWRNLYRLCNHDCLDADFEAPNWYVATRPQSAFVNNLIVTRAAADGARLTFLNGRSSIRPRGGAPQRRMLADADIGPELRDRFLLALPPETITAALAALAAKGTRAADHPFFG
jgi:N-hydroxyarylamine O-acetyltransferase